MPSRQAFPAFGAMMMAVVLLAVTSPSARAVEPSEILPNAELEKRARTLSEELRCVVCQNQSIDDSNAPLAKDLRVLVRERIVAGDTDRQVLDYIVTRYGEFVLLRPPLGLHTLLLWLAPLSVLALAVIFIARHLGRRSSEAAPVGLTAEEQSRLQVLLDAADERR